MHEHKNYMVKLHVQINASILMKYTTFAKKFSQLFINYGAGLHSTISHV